MAKDLPSSSVMQGLSLPRRSIFVATRIKGILGRCLVISGTHLERILLKEDTTMILLETMAGKGTELGRNIDELKYI